MSRIIVYSDLQKTYTDHSDVMVKKIEDYVDAYIAILEAIYNQLPLVVVVQNKYCLNYLQKMQERYSEKITFKINSPRIRFQELVGIEIPNYISEEDIVRDELNQKIGEISFNIGMDFADNILNHYLGNYFINSHFPFPKLVDFLKRIDSSLLTASKDKIILNKVYKVRMKLWQENCHEDYQVDIINAYLENPKILLTKVAAYLMLKDYPKSLAKDIIGELTKSFEKLRLKEEAFIPIGMDTLDIQRNIRILLNQRTISDLTYDDIVREIECLAGLFNEELQFVYSVLGQNRSVLDASILHHVRAKFKTGTQLDSMFDEKLNNIVPPAEVVNPENLATLNQWISWATDNYLPYKFWMEANDVCDTKIDNYSTRYGDWIFNNYDSIISSEGSMLHRTMANLSPFFKEDELSFLVIIDNFNYKFAPLCKDYLSSKGFSTTMDQPMISMIPTETSVSKTAIFSGQPFNTEVKSYENMSKEWESLLGGKVQYLSDIGKLDSILEKTAKLYILNYLSIDKILHESQNDSALPISSRIQEELKAMIDKLVNFSKRLGIENTIKVYFTSDHGSTKISKEQMNLIDSKYYKSKSEDCAYRFIALPDKKFDIYKDSIGHLCYVLDRNNYGIRENYLIAKGYNRFMATDLSFYVHGGITPEENIIPLLKFERVNVTLIQPEMLLRSSGFRYSTTSTIQLTIKNHNEYALNKIKITIHNTNIRWEQGAYRLQEIEKESQMDIHLEKVRILKSSSENEKLSIKISFFFLGKEYEQDHEFPINMKSAQETQVDLNELF